MTWQVRRDGLIVTETGGDLIVYDEERAQIHTLNALASSIWRNCENTDSVDDLATRLGTSPDVISTAIATLQNANLVTGTTSNHLSPSTVTRRRLMRRIGIGGAATLPIIVSISAPQASAANSLCPQAVPDDACASGMTDVVCLSPEGECGRCNSMSSMVCQEAGNGLECQVTQVWSCEAG